MPAAVGAVPGRVAVRVGVVEEAAPGHVVTELLCESGQCLVRRHGGAAGLRALLVDQGQDLLLGGRPGVGRLRRGRAAYGRRRGRPLGGLGGPLRTGLRRGRFGRPVRRGGRRGGGGGGGAVGAGGRGTGAAAARLLRGAVGRGRRPAAQGRGGLRQRAGPDAVSVVAARSPVELAVAGDQSGGDRHGPHRHRGGRAEQSGADGRHSAARSRTVSAAPGRGRRAGPFGRRCVNSPRAGGFGNWGSRASMAAHPLSSFPRCKHRLHWSGYRRRAS